MKIHKSNEKEKLKNDFNENEKEIISFDDKIQGNEIVSFNFDDDLKGGSSIKNEINFPEGNIKNNNFNADLCCDKIEEYSKDAMQYLKSSERLIPLSKIHKTKFLNSSGLTKNENGAAHIIDGEAPDSKRCYTLRSSTVRKLSELKSIHPDINICVSTIVDLAVNYFYSCIKEE